MRKNLDPVTGKIVPVFFYYTIPSVISIIALTCAGVIDGYFLGNFAGTTSLAAVTLTIPVSGFLFGLALMLSIGGAIRCGKFLGKGNIEAANASFSQTIVIILLLSIALSATAIIFMDHLVFLLGADKNLALPVAEYLEILLPFTAFQLGAVCLSYYHRVDNFPFWAAISMTAGTFLNIFLDWLLVVHFHMDHKGAALGTGLAAVISFLLLAIPFLSRRPTLKFHWRQRDFPEVLKAAVTGFPELIDEFSIGIIVIIFNWIIMKKLGENGIAAFAVINYLILIGLVTSYGISDSLLSVVSRNSGALKHKRIKKVMLLSTASVFAVGIVSSLLLISIPKTISTLFLDAENRKTLQLTQYFIARVWPIFLVNGINIVLTSYLTAVNRYLQSSLIILTRNLLLPVIFLFIIHFVLGNDAIVIVLPLSELVAFCIAVYLLFRYSPGVLPKNASQTV